MVDSFGGIMPDDVKEIVRLVKSKTKVSLGFHGHDNLHMGLINTITALNEGCDMVDATITGMGRGAGNLKTELLLTYLESKNQLNFKFKWLSNVVSTFEELNKNYRWGTSLPYMFSGAHSLPQKEVMEWVGMNRYSLNSILTALYNKKSVVKDNIKLPILKENKGFKTAVILGGGQSIQTHNQAIIKYAELNEDICLIHAGIRNILKFDNINSKQFCALVGVEADKLSEVINNIPNFSHTCVFPPYPRTMGTSIPAEIEKKAKELEAIQFTKVSLDSPLAVAAQIAIELGVMELFLGGFDGYDTETDDIQFSLAQENQKIIEDLIKIENINVRSLTPTKYKKIQVNSIYSLLK
jgi:4-hydroxy 2-oxovalerate aldolase